MFQMLKWLIKLELKFLDFLYNNMHIIFSEHLNKFEINLMNKYYSNFFVKQLKVMLLNNEKLIKMTWTLR
jgi:hypothetical protein